MGNTHDNLQHDISTTVTWALKEDLGGTVSLKSDITAMLIPENNQATATIISRDACVVCGTAWVDEVFKQLDPTITIQWHVQDGDTVVENTLLCTLAGNAQVLLTGERSALNFLQTLSGTATLVKQYVTALQGSNTQLLDTRKTLPGLRSAQKYAVKCAGGKNHRIGLFDAYLIKENHIAACGGIKAAVETAKYNQPDKIVEVEVENLDELKQAIDAHADIVMLDNFTPAMIEQAVSLNQHCDHQVKFEVSGNMTMEILAKYAKAGVDYISVGALTKHVTATDLSMRFVD